MRTVAETGKGFALYNLGKMYRMHKYYFMMLIFSHISKQPLYHFITETNLCRIRDNTSAFGIAGSGKIFYCHTISRIVSFLPI